MDWTALRDRLRSRPDVAVLCRRHGFADVDELLDAAERGRADELIGALVDDGHIGVEVALAALAPHLRRAVRGLRAWTGEDVGELAVAAAWERLQRGNLPRRPTRSVVDQARKSVVRELQRSWRRAVATTPIRDARPTVDTWAASQTAGRVVAAAGSVEDEALRRVTEAGLVAWAVRTGRLDPQTARIVVHSRAWGVPMGDLAEAEGLTYHAAYRRRQRAEARLRSSVHSGAALLPIT